MDMILNFPEFKKFLRGQKIFHREHYLVIRERRIYKIYGGRADELLAIVNGTHEVYGLKGEIVIPKKRGPKPSLIKKVAVEKQVKRVVEKVVTVKVAAPVKQYSFGVVRDDKHLDSKEGEYEIDEEKERTWKKKKTEYAKLNY